jgi:hypothetical protein
VLSDRPGDPPGGPGRARAYDRADRALSDRCDDLPGRPGRGPAYDLDRHRTADDRAVEALLASVSEPCTAQQLACGLGWTLNRTVGALRRLEASLANTGQILTRLGHHSYALGPRPGLVDDRQIARCLRHNHKALDVTAAAVLHRALTRPREERAREALRNPAERAAAERLIAAGLLEDNDGVLWPTQRTEATFEATPHRRCLR